MSYGREFLDDHAYEIEHGLPIKELSIYEERKINKMKVLILGNSGTGKSTSLRNFDPDDVCVINCAGKPLPFKNKFEQVTPSYDHLTADVINAIDSTKKKVIVVDDAQYIMSFQFMRRIDESGWNKWNDIQADFFKIIQCCDYLPKDITVYFLSHITTDENGFEKIKTMGKMLDEKITIEGLFTTVLKTKVIDGKYYFITQNSGKDTVKSPIGLFDSYAIDNDLKYVDEKIRNYYEIGDYVSDEEIEKMDAEAATDIEKPEKGRRRKKRNNTTDKQDQTTDEKSKEKKEKEEADNTTESDNGAEIKSIREDNEKGKKNESGLDKGLEEVEDEKKKRRTRKPRPIDASSTNKDDTGRTDNESAEADKSEQHTEISTDTSDKPRKRKRKSREEVITDDDDIPF